MNSTATPVTSELDYREQSAYDLRLSVIEGNFDLSQFQIFKTKILRVSSEFTLSAMIIGQSHAVCFRVGDSSLYEIFACGEVRTSKSGALSRHLDEVAGSLRMNFHRGLRYGFQATPKNWLQGSAEILEMESEAKEFGGFSLSYDFPQGVSRKPATTVVTGFANETSASLVIRTAHSYPNEGTIVISKSELSAGKNRCE